MKTAATCTLLTLLGTMLIPLLSVAADDGYAPLDPATLSSVSSENLVTAAYITIFTLFAAYTARLILRHRANTHNLKRLRDRLH